jgi:cytochrome c oxidase cbb3-type subunit 3
LIRLRRIAGLLLVAMLVAASVFGLQRRSLHARLVRTEPHRILEDPELLKEALRLGAPLYAQDCAGCHGTQLQGDPRRGAPNLARGAWLYGNDPIDVEHTIYYGIRSGHPKARNLTDMPALVRTGQITAQDDRDVVEFLQSIAGQPHDDAAALRGQRIYYNKGNCYDCHAHDARGVVDYGTPALTGPVYLYGGDRETLFQSILNGRHGKCPAWVTRLTPLQIRALALYLVTAASRSPMRRAGE